MTIDLTLVIPCYNEIENIPNLRDSLFPVVEDLQRERTVEIVFVDDGSTDGTYQALADHFGHRSNVSILRHESNKGLGAAIRTGCAAAKGETIITTDSDATYRFSEIPALLAHLAPGIDLVTASPYQRGGAVKNIPAYRLILSHGASFLYRLLVDWRIATYTSLFRAYRRKVVEEVSFDSDDYLANAEILVNAIYKGYQVAEYPTVLHIRTYGTSKTRIIRTIKAHLCFLVKILLRRLRLTSPHPLT
jgi:dolichol-phosphate mannosyltransferase